MRLPPHETPQDRAGLVVMAVVVALTVGVIATSGGLVEGFVGAIPIAVAMFSAQVVLFLIARRFGERDGRGED